MAPFPGQEVRSLPGSSDPALGAPRRRLSLRAKIALAAFTGLVILLAVSAVTVVSAIRIRRSFLELSRLHLIAETIRTFNNTMLSLESGQRGYLLTGDTTYLAQYDTALNVIQRRLDSLHRAGTPVPADSGRLAAIDSLLQAQIINMNATISTYRTTGLAAALALVRTNRGLRITDSLRSTLRPLSRAEEAQRLQVAQLSGRTGRLLILAEVLGGLLAVGLVVVALRQIYGDLDRREAAEASLRRSERFLDSMVDLMPMMVFVKDARDLKYLRMNQASIKIMGRSREELIGKTDFDLFPEPIAQAHETLDREVLSGTSPQEVMEEVPLGPDGEIRTFYRRKIALRDEQTGEPAFVLGVSEDITDRKRVEAQILKSRQDAEDASRAKSDFLARMSHELRTPLNSIIGFSQLLDEQNFGPLNERQQRYVTHVLTSGRQLLELINDILDLSKVEAGRMELSLVETDVLLLMREALAFVEPLAAAKKMRLVLDVPEALPALLLDPGRFRQILYNLLGNALKFTPASGTITLRAALLGNSSVRITVSDTGIGIGAADLDRIFGEFEQVDSDLVRAHQGTGLGLPLARRLAELHRGRLTAESEIGRGSHFHLELPVLTPAPVAGAA